MQDPLREYTERLERRKAAAAREKSRERRLSNFRLLSFAAFVLLAWFAWVRPAVSAMWVLLPVIAFAVLAVLHERTIRARKVSERAASYYRRGVERLGEGWQAHPNRGERFADPHHPYAADLDLFGTASLFQRISSARTRGGEETLASWLLTAAPRAEIAGRQKAVEELRERIDFREDLAVLGEDVDSGIHPGELIGWAERSAPAFKAWERLIAPILGIAALASAIALFPPFRVGPIPITVALLLEFLFLWHVRGRVNTATAGVEKAADDLELLGLLLRRVEREPFTSPRLVTLRETIQSEGEAPSARIARLERLIALLDSARNQFFAPFAALLLWKPQVAFAVARWRSRSGHSVRAWIDALGEIEALASLSAFAFENPGYPFPELAESGRTYRASGLGHPLIPASRRVTNDVAFGEAPQILIVSGSNMSGKSTMLRTVGINAVLAFAGAPVCGASLSLPPLQVGASIRINDSLQEGSSRFYSELTRLRQLVEIAGGGAPLLFLMDEVFHGTNSHDRRIGAEAVIASLVRRGAIGLVTTHDLALAEIAQRPELHAKNVHFEDHMEEGRMVFDYRMREGTVEKSNAIALMRAVGLEV